MAKSGWMGFVSDHRIPWVWGSGHRNIEIACRQCNDGSMKMGLHLESSSFGCWKKREHSGHEAKYLIQRLLNVSLDEADLLAQSYFSNQAYVPKQTIRSDAKPCNVPGEFFEFKGYAHELRFMRYIVDRNLDPSYLIPRFNLHGCYSGKYKERLIIPVIENSKWHTWVARSIDPDEQFRFKAGSTLPDKFGHIETENKPVDYLFNIDDLQGGDLLTLTEGFFDSAAITSAFIPRIDSTCTFGKRLSPAQMYKLKIIAPRYKAIALAYDATAAAETLKISNQLAFYIKIPVYSVVPDSKDWSVANNEEIRGKFTCLIN